MRLVPILFCSLILGGAAPSRLRAPEEYLQAGDAAFDRNELETALRHYEEAAERTADPGLVAFNKATALATAGRFDEAERFYFQAIDDPQISEARLANALYNRAVCLLHRDGVTHFRNAIDSLERVLKLPIDPRMESDARHNLEVAKLMWMEARTRSREKPLPNDPPRDPSPEPKRMNQNHNDENSQGGTSTEPKASKTNPMVDSTKPDKQPAVKPTLTQKTTGGRGNLPVELDPETWRPNSADEAREYLDRLTERLNRERRTVRDTLAPAERPNVKNW